MPIAPHGPFTHGPRVFRTRKTGAPSAAAVAASVGDSVVDVPPPSALTAGMVQMDMRLRLRGSYALYNGVMVTAFVTPVPFYGDTAVYLLDGTTHPLTRQPDLNNTVFTTPANVSLADCILGTKAPMRVDLSEVVARDSNDRPEIDLGVLLKTTTVLHRKATAFNVLVSHVRSDLWPNESYAWAPDLSVVQDKLLNRLRARIGTVAEDATVSIVNDSWEPVKIGGFEVVYEVMEGLR